MHQVEQTIKKYTELCFFLILFQVCLHPETFLRFLYGSLLPPAVSNATMLEKSLDAPQNNINTVNGIILNNQCFFLYSTGVCGHVFVKSTKFNLLVQFRNLK